MLPKNKRIRRSIFSSSFVEPKFFKNSNFLLKIGKNREEKTIFSVSVSKRVSKSAVVRNKIRRLGYKAFKENMEFLKKGLSAHLSFFSEVKNFDFLSNEIRKIFKK